MENIKWKEQRQMEKRKVRKKDEHIFSILFEWNFMTRQDNKYSRDSLYLVGQSGKNEHGTIP